MWSATFLIPRRILRGIIIVQMLYVTYPLFLSDFNETRKFSTDLRKYVKFHENLFSRSRVILCEQIDVTNLIVAFAGGRSDLLMLTIDRLSLPLLCTSVAPRDGRKVRLVTQSCVQDPWIWCQWFVGWLGVLSCFSFHTFERIQHKKLICIANERNI